MIPDWLLPQTVVVVTPSTSVDAHGNSTPDYGAGATRVTLAPGNTNGGVWLQQDQRMEFYPDGRNPQDQRWLMMTNYSAITTADRIEWAEHPSGSITFTVEGPPEPAYWPQLGFNHVEATLKVLDG